jgi:DNA-binding transcriptional regulator LsrR (DeoR family)
LVDGINDSGGRIACVAILANKTLQEVVDDYEMVAVDHGSTAEDVLEELLMWHEGT